MGQVHYYSDEYQRQLDEDAERDSYSKLKEKEIDYFDEDLVNLRKHRDSEEDNRSW